MLPHLCVSCEISNDYTGMLRVYVWWGRGGCDLAVYVHVHRYLICKQKHTHRHADNTQMRVDTI